MPPLAGGFTTVILAAPAVAMSAAVMFAVKLLPETKVVGRVLPFHATVEDGTKFVPVTAMMNAVPPWIAEPGVSSEMAGVGGLIVNVAAPEVPPPGAGVATATLAVPGVAMSAAVIAACRLVLDAKVVARALPFH